jgi:hypothetical protein
MRSHGSARERRLTWLASAITAIAALVVVTVGVRSGTFAAADSDPYGYVSEADLMAQGSLRVDQRFASTMPWPLPELTFSPPGYRPAPDGFIVPIYAPGLPLVMAAFQRIKGRNAVFYVVPLLGAIAVWMTGRLGTKIHGPLTGMLAAVLLGTSVIFLYQLLQPVSDVAATSWWTISLALTVAGSPLAALGAGLAASMAVLTRPNLVPLGAVIALFGGWRIVRAGPNHRRPAVGWLVLFALGMAPGCLAVAAINQHLHGSPLQSGYWDSELLYSWAHLVPNLDRYPRWLVKTSASYICLALGAPWLVRNRGTRSAAEATLRRDHVWLLLAFSAAIFLSYLFYVPWGRQEWGYLRFVLPSYPALIVLSVVVARELLGRVSDRNGVCVGLAIVLCGALAAWQAREAVRLGAFTTKVTERRYVDVGRYVAAALPRNAIFIAGAESGSLRYYSNRLTVRYDLLDPRWLDRAVEALRQKGYHPYLALEEAEEAPFRDRFGARNALARLDWPAAVERSEQIRVRIYDPADRERFLAGEPIVTEDTGFIKRTLTVK